MSEESNPTTYPQFPQIEDCDERLRQVEQSKDQLISKLQTQLSRSAEMVRRLQITVDIRREVHRDDYLRSGHLIAALQQIMAMTPEEAAGKAGDLASRTLYYVWGVDLPAVHCANHAHYRASCPDCRALSPSAARGDEGGRPVPDLSEEEEREEAAAGPSG